VRFLADESCDFSVVRALRAWATMSLLWRSCPVASRIELARTDSRVLLTEDKDFGQLVFSARRLCGCDSHSLSSDCSTGMKLLRMAVTPQASRVAARIFSARTNFLYPELENRSTHYHRLTREAWPGQVQRGGRPLCPRL
jgi:hypothetical protein